MYVVLEVYLIEKTGIIGTNVIIDLTNREFKFSIN